MRVHLMSPFWVRLSPAVMTCAGPLTEQERSCRAYSRKAESDPTPVISRAPAAQQSPTCVILSVGSTEGVSRLYVVFDALVSANWNRINTLALGARLPTMSNNRAHVEVGALMSYAPNSPALFRRAADYADKILRGAKPGDLPVEQPTKFDLVINLVTAKALGLTIPPTLLARADEVIE